MKHQRGVINGVGRTVGSTCFKGDSWKLLGSFKNEQKNKTTGTPEGGLEKVGLLGASERLLEASWGPLGASLEPLAHFLAPLGSFLAPLGGFKNEPKIKPTGTLECGWKNKLIGGLLAPLGSLLGGPWRF